MPRLLTCGDAIAGSGWPASSRNGGRHQIGTPAGFISESVAGFNRNPHPEGVIDGWGKHYWFCNDVKLLSEIDKQVTEQVRRFLGAYRDVRIKLTPEQQRPMLGLSLIHI